MKAINTHQNRAVDHLQTPAGNRFVQKRSYLEKSKGETSLNGRSWIVRPERSVARGMRYSSSTAPATDALQRLRYFCRLPSEKLVRVPGVEPGSMASEATTLSIVLHSQERGDE